MRNLHVLSDPAKMRNMCVVSDGNAHTVSSAVAESDNRHSLEVRQKTMPVTVVTGRRHKIKR